MLLSGGAGARQPRAQQKLFIMDVDEEENMSESVCLSLCQIVCLAVHLFPYLIPCLDTHTHTHEGHTHTQCIYKTAELDIPTTKTLINVLGFNLYFSMHTLKKSQPPSHIQI